MTFSALDSALVGPLFATEEMRACFSDEARLRAMLATEAALARAEAALASQEQRACCTPECRRAAAF